ncbi:hypothetical protein L3X38_038880 [Prunus dulcis]|uniref:Retrotransposon Copia-like N-terminal domain-containing protein n=1 Tax=Prunus dulcis TaxID=3755 RepID=A0AAD4V872_PRUDU|nr:hypothetical protein L3X38_038880 [Prunus dulcis]
MAEEKGAGSQIVPAAAPIMVQSENSSFNIGMVLDEKNYDLWAPLIQIHIAGRKKMGYLRGSIKEPNEDDPKYDDWFSEDQKIKSWLLSSMKPEIMKRYIRLSTSKEIWDSLKTAYFDENDEARIYSLNQKASRLRQNGRPLATYFGELTEIFQELDHFNKVSMECENDIKVFQKSTERQRVYVFLGGLDDRFDQVRGEVLRKDPPLGLQASYAYVRREADRKEAMKTEVDKSEPAAMAAKARGSPYGPNREGSQNRPGQTRTSQPSRDLLTRDNTEVLTFDYSHVARNELHEEQPLQSSRMEYTAPREGQQSTCHGDQLTTSGDGQQPVCFGHQSTEQVPEEQQTLQEEEEHPIGPTGFGLDDELQPTICNGTEQQLQQLPRDFPSDVISDPSINSSYLNSHNQSSSTPDATPLRRLPERINRGLRSKLVFAWDQVKCTDSGFKTLEKRDKPLFLKEL